jgi:DNA-binding transcriptional LysR family regulator
MQSGHPSATSSNVQVHTRGQNLEQRWDDYRTLLGIVREGSFQAAAESAGVATSTLSRHMAAWERRLGTRIFDRHSRGVVLTEAGRQLFALAQRLYAQVVATERELRDVDRALAGAVHLTAGEGFGEALLPIIAEFRALYPQIDLTLTLDTRIYDLERREADLAIRMPRPKEKQLLVRKLGELRFRLFASPRYLDRCGTPTALSELSHHDFVGFAGTLQNMLPDQYLRSLGAARFSIRVNNTALVRKAALDGFGLALLVPESAAGLTPVMPELHTDPLSVWLVRHKTAQKTRRLNVLADFLARRFAELTKG